MEQKVEKHKHAFRRKTDLLYKEAKVEKPKHGFRRKTDALYEADTKKFIEGFWILDLLGNFVNVNSTFCKMMGYSRNEILQMNLLEIESGVDSIQVIRRLHATVSSGSSWYAAQYRCKNGSIVEFEVYSEYVKRSGGKVFAVLRPKAANRITQEDKKKQEHSEQDLNVRLAESYRQLGIANRKIPLLLELGRYPRSVKHRKKILGHVLDMAINISQANTGFLYRSLGRGTFALLSAKGVEKNKIKKISTISPKTMGLLKQLMHVKYRLSGDIREHDVSLLAFDNKMQYFITLPLSQGGKIKGMIFLGFGPQKKIETHELEFLDVFAMHASAALINAKALD